MDQFTNSKQLGLLDSSKVSWAVNNGLLHYDGEDYCLTDTAMRKYTNFFRWITGNYDHLILSEKYTKSDTKPVVKKKGKVTASDVADLFSGL